MSSYASPGLGLCRHCFWVGLCWLSWAGGLGLPLAGGPQDATAEQIEARAPKHLTLHHFEAIDMAFHRSSAPGQGDARFDRLMVLVQPRREAAQCLQRTGGRAREPRPQAARAGAGGPAW
jgi:hypothetical protein